MATTQQRPTTTPETTSKTIDVTDRRVATEEFIAKVNAHDLDGLLAMCSDDIVLLWLPSGTYRGTPAVREQFEQLFAAFPDFRRDGEIIAVDGDTVVSEAVATGTFSGGPFAGFAPTGAQGRVRVLESVRFRGDAIVRLDTYWDGLEMARALGVMPGEGTVAERLMRGATNLTTRARQRGGRLRTGRMRSRS